MSLAYRIVDEKVTDMSLPEYNHISEGFLGDSQYFEAEPAHAEDMLKLYRFREWTLGPIDINANVVLYHFFTKPRSIFEAYYLHG